mmetsp:Transcript_42941/g.77611  ORF Transcript_42941/g.77611 Transcript_42941/m.77611 type:complete len:288 (-) Transcript_42941:108-971(-)
MSAQKATGQVAEGKWNRELSRRRSTLEHAACSCSQLHTLAPASSNHPPLSLSTPALPCPAMAVLTALLCRVVAPGPPGRTRNLLLAPAAGAGAAGASAAAGVLGLEQADTPAAARPAGACSALLAPLLYELGGHHLEGGVHVGGVLGGALDVGDAQVVRLLLGLLCGDLPLRLHVALVADQNLAGALVHVSVHLVQPVVHVRKGLAVADVVDQDDPVCSAVVRTRDGTEAFLPCRIPNLELDGLLVDGNGLEAEVNTDRCDIALRKGIICEAQKKTRLSRTGVANED